MNNKAHRIKLNKKWLSVLLTICMVISLIPATVMADAGKTLLSFKMDDPVPVDAGNTSETTVYSDATQAALYLRSQMVNRNDNVVFLYDMEHETLSSQGLIDTIYDTALAETGVGYEGEYIRRHIKAHGYSLTQTEEQKGTWQVTITFTFIYRSTAEQEAEVTAEINRVLGTMDLKGKTDYEKFVMIYDYIVRNTTYDTPGLNNGDPLVYTAWAAAIRHKAVCQGYASLLYRMLWQAGVPNRFIAGCTDPSDPEHTGHAWNIVKIDGIYYNVDATWDANEAKFGTVGGIYDSQYLMSWRLVADDLEHFPRHYRDDSYTTSEFYSQYPMSSTDYPKPSVLGYALDLESSVALKFMVYIPEFIDKDSVYVDFSISDGGTSTVAFDDLNATDYGANTYWYICRLNTLELADEVTATIHYGDSGDKVVNKITAQKYCQYLLSRSDYSSRVHGMCEALLNLGYYMQQTDWKDDRGAHKPITCVSAISSEHKNDVKAAVEDYAFIRPSNEVYTKVAYSLTFNTQMSINVYYQLNPRYTSTDTVIQKNGEDWYTFSKTDLYPYWYDEMFSFSDGKVSVLSYVNSVLKNTGNRFSTEKQDAMVALYDYYAASEEFFKS